MIKRAEILDSYGEKVLFIVANPLKNNSKLALTLQLEQMFQGKENLEESFLADSESIKSHLRKTESELVRLSLPKFDISFQTSLVNVLEEVNVTEIFSADADFSEISDIPLSVHDILHKTRIIVDEEGAEAAAASGALLDTRLGACFKDNLPFWVE